MSFGVKLAMPVAFEGATFYFGNADAEFGAVVALGRRAEREGREVDDTDPQLIGMLCALFDAAIRGWRNVVDENTGDELVFSPETAAQFPTLVKVELVNAYITQQAMLTEKKGAGDGAPTPSMPP